MVHTENLNFGPYRLLEEPEIVLVPNRPSRTTCECRCYAGKCKATVCSQSVRLSVSYVVTVMACRLLQLQHSSVLHVLTPLLHSVGLRLVLNDSACPDAACVRFVVFFASKSRRTCSTCILVVFISSESTTLCELINLYINFQLISL